MSGSFLRERSVTRNEPNTDSLTYNLRSDSPVPSSVLRCLRLTDCQRATTVYYVDTRENGEGTTAEHGAVSTLVEPPIDVSHEQRDRRRRQQRYRRYHRE